MSYVGYIIAGLLFLWIYISPLIWLYWYFKPEHRSIASRRLVYIVAVGAFLAVFMLLAAGFESALVFIPSGILVRSGENFLGEPEYETLRYSLASLFGINIDSCQVFESNEPAWH